MTLFLTASRCRAFLTRLPARSLTYASVPALHAIPPSLRLVTDNVRHAALTAREAANSTLGSLELTPANRASRLLASKYGDATGVSSALDRLLDDMTLLETQSDEYSRLSAVEWTVLTGSVLLATGSPIMGLGPKVADFLAPSCAALCATIGVTSEYIGRVAVADGKEVAARTMQCACEAEALLAKSERTKAVLPLCVGIGATAASISLLAPVLVEQIGISSLQAVTEVYLLCPLLSVLSAAVAGLATQESAQQAERAISVGNRRFARSGRVGRTWLSASEQIQMTSLRYSAQWRAFAFSVVPAPLMGALVPGSLESRAIVIAALAAAQSAYFLARAELVLARATDAVALKSRSAAVADTYANQGARSGAILPFTSALSALCAAATAAVVELVPHLTPIQTGLALGLFPAAGAACAAAAGVSRARCEVDAEASIAAAETLAIEYGDGNKEDSLLKPMRGVQDLLRLTVAGAKKWIVGVAREKLGVLRIKLVLVSNLFTGIKRGGAKENIKVEDRTVKTNKVEDLALGTNNVDAVAFDVDMIQLQLGNVASHTHAHTNTQTVGKKMMLKK